MPKVAIFYRREDSLAISGRIYDRLVAHFGRDNVFRDICNIPIGVDFKEFIREALKEIDVVLILIGPRWLSGKKPRIKNPADPVRVEIEWALQLAVPMIPILVSGARFPRAEELPESIQDVVYRNGMEVGTDHILIATCPG